jgi:hypothetical protein
MSRTALRSGKKKPAKATAQAAQLDRLIPADWDDEMRFRATIPPPNPQGDVLRERVQELQHEQAKVEVRRQAESGTERINWKRSKRELADHMASLFQSGVIEARNEADLLRQIVKHFVVQGETLDENSLRTNLADLRNDRLGNKK